MPEKMGKPASKAGIPSFDFDAGQSRNVLRPDRVSDWTAGRNSFFNQMKIFSSNSLWLMDLDRDVAPIWYHMAFFGSHLAWKRKVGYGLCVGVGVGSVLKKCEKKMQGSETHVFHADQRLH